MDNRLLGVIDATTYHEDLAELTRHRSLAAIPFGGRYRLIDFILSNMVNSEIESVAIFPKYQYRSLMDHLGSGKNWDLDRKRDGLFFFPTPNLDVPSKGIGSFDHFAENIDYFKRSKQEYALITNCYTVINMDFRPVLKRHIQSGCGITVIHKDGKPLEMYIVKTSLLIDLIQTRDITGYTCLYDCITDMSSSFTVCDYEYTGMALMINSIQSYFSANMKLLQPNEWQTLFVKNQPIYTKVKDEPPTRYAKGSAVRNAMIANGCQIEGTVENSIIARGVKIGKGTVVRNSIILQKCEIGENCVIESAILDKDVKAESRSIIKGTEDLPHVIRKGTVQGALMNS